VDRDRIERLQDEGLTMLEIAAEIGVSSATVCRLLKSHRRPQNLAAGL
jgi:IS30 family transposase